MKRILFFTGCIALFSTSCMRIEHICIDGEALYRITDEYFPSLEEIEPPHLLEMKGGGVVGSEIYRVQWNNHAIIATQYSKKETVHNYYMIIPKDSVLTGHDVQLGPLTERQRDSVLRSRHIDTIGMQVIDFN